MSSPARVAADVAAVLSLTDPLGLLARQRLAVAVRDQERRMNESTLMGTPLRDAAVDPRPEDFPGVPNAGEANPHGPNVRCIEVDSLLWQQRVAELRGGQD